MRADTSSTSSPRADLTSRQTGHGSRLRRRTVFAVFAAIVAAAFLLRIFYAGHLYQDDGLWFTAAEELLRGKALYRDVYFDKPPAMALLYAALFKLFGAHILTIRLFTIAYSVAVSAALYVFGRRFYGERIGLTSAAMFAVFSTIFTTGHVQGLNTDFLMMLPHAAGVYWLLRSRDDAFGRGVTRRQGSAFALAGGLSVGVATQINPKGAFALVFFALFLLLARFWDRKRDAGKSGAGTQLRVWILSLVGFMLGTLPFVIYLAKNQALGFYWRYVWDWGVRYARYYPAWRMIVTAVGQAAYYFLINNTLLVGLLFVAVTAGQWARRTTTADAKPAAEADSVADAAFRADAALLLWFAVSFIAMSVGGRFFGHYFFQVLPALCLIGGRGIVGVVAALAAQKSRGRVWRRVLLALLVLGFAVTVVRFHTRTAQMAADWARGAESEATRRWFHGRLNLEEREVAAVVKNLQPEAVEQLGIEAMRRGGPRERPPAGPSDYLFVWGYRPEIYYWSGLLPASKYLSTQPLTGVPADVHYFDSDYRVVLDERDTAAAREELAQELERVQPEYVVDELGFFNDHLAMARYGEFGELLSRYKYLGSVERFLIYRRRDMIKAQKRDRQDDGGEAAGPR